jgi:hypothetical protein
MSAPLLHRQVLAAMGTWSIARALAYPDVGVSGLRTSRWGSSSFGPTRFVAPWPDRSGFDCQPHGIDVGPTAYARGSAWCTVTWREVTVACTGIDSLDRAEVIASLRESHRIAENLRCLRLPLKSTDKQQLEQARAVAPLYAQLRKRSAHEADLIHRALRVDDVQPTEPTDLLELLAMGGVS